MGTSGSKERNSKERDKSPNIGRPQDSGKILDDEEYLKMVKRRREKDAAKHE